MKGLFLDLPKHALARNGVLGDEAESEATSAEATVFAAFAVLKDNPKAAFKLAHEGWDSLSVEQKANLEGRLLGRAGTGVLVSAVSPLVGPAATSGAAVGSISAAGADINDVDDVIHTILYGVPQP